MNLDIARAINTVIVLHLCKCNSDHPMRTKIFIIARSQTRHGAMLPCRWTLRFVLHSRLSHPNEVHAMADETLTITIAKSLSLKSTVIASPVQRARRPWKEKKRSRASSKGR